MVNSSLLALEVESEVLEAMCSSRFDSCSGLNFKLVFSRRDLRLNLEAN